MIDFEQLINNSSPALVGVLNLTPDSFSDGGEFNKPEIIQRKIDTLFSQGTNIVDIGAESTRPGSKPVDDDTEIQRLKMLNLPLISMAHKYQFFSIDTYKATTATFALENGFHIINDISGLTHDPNMLKVAANYRCGIIIMHNHRLIERKNKDIIIDIKDNLSRLADKALKAGIRNHQICLDPGIGFGLEYEENLTILNNLNQIKALGFTLMVGASRKSFIGQALDIFRPQDRLYGTLAAHTIAFNNGADMLRVHDVQEHYEFFKMYGKLKNQT